MPASDELLDTPLWAFSLSVYARDGVADECLGLQERLQLDVNLLLFVAFAGTVDGILLESRDIAAACATCASWHGDIVRTLRAVRRALKAPSTDASNPLREASAALRAQVKAAELDAEKIEQGLLWQWSRAQLAGRPHSDRAQALAANLLGLLRFYGLSDAEAEAAVPRLLAAAADYARMVR